jgi:hypothetical protein
VSKCSISPGTIRDQLPVVEALAGHELDRLGGRVDLLDGVYDQLDVAVEQLPLRADELLGPLLPHRDVHVAGLVGVVAGLIDDRDPGLAGGDLLLELAGDQVGGEGASNAAAQDDDVLHGRPTGPSRR